MAMSARDSTSGEGEDFRGQMGFKIATGIGSHKEWRWLEFLQFQVAEVEEEDEEEDGAGKREEAE